jgi:hypothetical protein
MLRVPEPKHKADTLKKPPMVLLRKHLQGAQEAGFSRLETLMPNMFEQQSKLLPQRAHKLSLHTALSMLNYLYTQRSLHSTLCPPSPPPTHTWSQVAYTLVASRSFWRAHRHFTDAKVIRAATTAVVGVKEDLMPSSTMMCKSMLSDHKALCVFVPRNCLVRCVSHHPPVYLCRSSPASLRTPPAPEHLP